MSTIDAISGLLVSSNALDVISNNIANASTIGFKSTTLAFYDMVSNSLSSDPSKGCGVRIANLVQNFNDGTLINTGRDFDIGINKNGFFRVMDASGFIHYTRNGQFSLDEEKNLVNMQGMHVIGKSQNNYEDQNAKNNLKPINFKQAYILKTKPTTTIKFKPILNSTVDPANNTKNSSENYNTSLTIYNNKKKSKIIDINFLKKENVQHQWTVTINSRKTAQEKNEYEINNSFDLEFDSEGKLIPLTSPMEIKNGPEEYDKMILDLTGILEKPETNASFIQASQNGYPEGTLKTFDILHNGSIMGTYSNLQKNEIGKIILAKFINPDKLNPEGANVWSSTIDSGDEILGTAGSEGFGTITNKTLESSNVDLNKELINMIVAQRNYQSNAQALKTEDKIISTLVNLR